MADTRSFAERVWLLRGRGACSRG